MGLRPSLRAHRCRCPAATAAAAAVVTAAVASSAFVGPLRSRGRFDATLLAGRTPPALSPALRGWQSPCAAGTASGRWDLGFEWDSLDEAISSYGTEAFTDITSWKLPVEETSTKAAVETVQKWLTFLKGQGSRGAEALYDAAGYPLEQSLELFTEELHRGASIVTMQLPAGSSTALGNVGLVAAIRTGEDLDLSLFGGGEWETIHLDFMATNPIIGWASEGARQLLDYDALKPLQRLREAGGGGLELLQSLLNSAAKAGRAVTVAPMNDDIKEHYRMLGFQEDSLLDPSLMFWIPTDEVLIGFGMEPKYA